MHSIALLFNQFLFMIKVVSLTFSLFFLVIENHFLPLILVVLLASLFLSFSLSLSLSLSHYFDVVIVVLLGWCLWCLYLMVPICFTRPKLVFVVSITSLDLTGVFFK